jgi:glutathione S-transferase
MLTLVIGNKNYSSWSLRPWLALKMAEVPFEEIRVVLSRPTTTADILRYSPSARVPCLLDGNLRVWDSLAICEYVNERYASGRMWPTDVQARAQARSVAAEMHSSFAALRGNLPMDIRGRLPERGRAAQQRSDVAADIKRVQEIWQTCLDASGGPFLFGAFSIADAFYAPVVTRFITYVVTLAPTSNGYVQRMLDLAPLRQWSADGAAEPETIDQ